MKRTGSACWTGSLNDGKGVISTESGALTGEPFGAHTRFADGSGTNPEELIGGAHAGCFVMALSKELGAFGITPGSLEAHAQVELVERDGGLAIARSDIALTLEAGDADPADIRSALKAAEKNCPVSAALNAEISIELTLQT